MTCWWICCLLAVHLAYGLRSIDGCGIRKAPKDELGNHGNQLSPGEWPWHAGLFRRIKKGNPRYLCGGSIIASNYILTAAHCTYTKVQQLKKSKILVRVGITSIRKLEHSLQQKRVAEIIRHGQYNETYHDNDIALLKLTKEVQITDYVSPICLWSESDKESIILKKEGYVAAWGQDKDKFSAELKQEVMSIVSNEICLKSDPDAYGRTLNEGTICAKFTNGTYTGEGNSGSGLYIEVDGQWILRGIMFSGKLDKFGQFDSSSYDVFTNVLYYMPWIIENMEFQTKKIKSC